jgi:hypothetical protein
MEHRINNFKEHDTIKIHAAGLLKPRCAMMGRIEGWAAF